MIQFNSATILSTLTPLLSNNPVIVEAGAFTGNDTKKFASQWPLGVIHAFEPVPELYQQLVKTCTPFNNVCCYQTAVGSHTGTTNIHLMTKKNNPFVPSQASSLLTPTALESLHPKMNYTGTTLIPVITLTDWMMQHQISHINLLWLDLQGYELAVLKTVSLLDQVVDVILTEVNFVPRYDNVPLYQTLKEWMITHNFSEIGRDFELHSTERFGNSLFMSNLLHSKS